MKLSADMILHHLNQTYSLIMHRPYTGNLLPEPELYTDNGQTLREGHQYLALAQQLSHRPMIEKNVLLICIGESARLSYYKEHAAVLQIRQEADILQVYSSIQSLYHSFSQWEFEEKVIAM